MQYTVLASYPLFKGYRSVKEEFFLAQRITSETVGSPDLFLPSHVQGLEIDIIHHLRNLFLTVTTMIQQEVWPSTCMSTLCALSFTSFCPSLQFFVLEVGCVL